METVETIDLPGRQGTVKAALHAAAGSRTAVIMVGGAGGGLHGPAGIYPTLSDRLRQEGITALRVEYRRPNELDACVADVLAAIEGLAQRGIDRITLIGWSFGGAVVIRAGVRSDRVAGVATVASQTWGAESVGALAPKSLLLIHGTADTVLPERCSRDLYARAGEPKSLVLYPGDNHGLTGHAEELIEQLHGWCRSVLVGARLAGERAL